MSFSSMTKNTFRKAQTFSREKFDQLVGCIEETLGKFWEHNENAR